MQLKKLCAICSAVLVAFSCSLVPAVISPVYADDDAVTSGNTCSGYLSTDIYSINYGDNALKFWPSVSNYDGTIPFSGNCNSPDFSRDGTYFVRELGGTDFGTTNFYPDLSVAVTLYTPVTVGLHMLCKVGMASSYKATGYSGYSTHAYYQVGGGGYTATNATVTTIGNSAWSTPPKMAPGSSYFADYSTGYCFRVDLPYPYGSNGFAINGIGLWISDFMQSTHGTLAPLLGYCVVWRDSGDSALDDAVTSLLTHVASIDGNVSSMLTSINQIKSYCNTINLSTTSMVSLLSSIERHITSVDDTVTDLYTLLHDTLADESAEIDNKSQQVAESIMQQDNAEQYWNDKNQENFDALDLNNFSFSSGVVSALGTVGNLFTSIWNSLGDTVVIFTFPLMLGITLVAIGRVSRHGGKGKSGKGGDSE